MSSNRVAGLVQKIFTAVRSLRERWFAGLTSKELALVALMCVLMALRRAGRDFFPLDDWLLVFGEKTMLELIALLPPTLAIVATYNLAPAAARWRYPALALAILISTAASIALVFVVQSGGSLEHFPNQLSRPIDVEVFHEPSVNLAFWAFVQAWPNN